MEYRLGELYCGPGGLSLGAINSKIIFGNEDYSITHQWATDYDKDSCDTYANFFCGKGDSDNCDSVICKNVKELDFSKLPQIEGLAFGFPCNDFSIVGESRGINGSYGPLYKFGVKALKHFQPDWFVAENVGGLRSSNEGKVFHTVMEELAESGYEITPHYYKFEYYKVPQRRHRIIIVGIRNDYEKKFRVPAPLNDENSLLTAMRAIEEPPIPPGAANNELTKQSKVVVERLKHIKAGENAFNADLPEHLKLNVKGAKLSQIYKRLSPHKPSYTITGSGGGGTHVYHWAENRALTNRERARLQTFPDHFIFKGSKESVRKQIGMAVPPKAAEVIFTAILNTLAGIEYESIEQNIPFSLQKELS